MAFTSSCSGALTFKVHPLVIANIIGHHTRLKTDASVTGATCRSAHRGFGCLLGIRYETSVEILTTYEIMFDPLIDNQESSLKAIQNRESLYKRLYPNLCTLGWYSTDTIDAEEGSELVLHKTLVNKLDHNPFYVLLNAAILDSENDSPISIYETKINEIDEVLFLKGSIIELDGSPIVVDYKGREKLFQGPGGSSTLPSIEEFNKISVTDLYLAVLEVIKKMDNLTLQVEQIKRVVKKERD